MWSMSSAPAGVTSRSSQYGHQTPPVRGQPGPTSG